MNRKTVLIAIGIILCLSGLKAQSAKQSLLAMPDSLLPLVTVSQLADLFDLHDMAEDAVIRDALGGEVRLTDRNDRYVRLEMENKYCEWVLMPVNNEEASVIIWIETVCAPICDSQLSFFSSSWELLDGSLFIEPASLEWFIHKNDNTPALDIEFMTYRYDKETNRLIQEQHASENLSMEDLQRIKPFIYREEKIFSWNGDRFE